MSDLESQSGKDRQKNRIKFLKFAIVSIVAFSAGCFLGSVTSMSNSEVQRSFDVFESTTNRASSSDEKQETASIKEKILGRWKQKSTVGVSEYIDAENGSMFYKIFAKKMEADVEYELLEPDVFKSTFYVSWMPIPLEYPLRFDEPYEYKSPIGDWVTSKARYRKEFNDIFVNTQGGSEGPTTTRIEIINDEMILTSTIVNQNISCKRFYARKA